MVYVYRITCGGGGVGKESVIFKSLGQCSENFLFNQVANERAVSD